MSPPGISGHSRAVRGSKGVHSLVPDPRGNDVWYGMVCRGNEECIGRVVAICRSGVLWDGTAG